MNTFHRIIVPVVALVVSAAACTGSGAQEQPASSASSAASGAGVQTSDVGDVTFEPGRFQYSFNGVTATLSMDGSTASLEVKNNSGAELGDPGMYVIDRNGKRFEGTVDAAAPVPNGESATFQVAFPDQVTPETVGLAVLLFGGSNYGNMAPVPVG